jgi:hypothetical protein
VVRLVGWCVAGQENITQGTCDPSVVVTDLKIMSIVSEVNFGNHISIDLLVYEEIYSACLCCRVCVVILRRAWDLSHNTTE